MVLFLRRYSSQQENIFICTMGHIRRCYFSSVLLKLRLFSSEWGRRLSAEVRGWAENRAECQGEKGQPSSHVCGPDLSWRGWDKKPFFTMYGQHEEQGVAWYENSPWYIRKTFHAEVCASLFLFCSVALFVPNDHLCIKSWCFPNPHITLVWAYSCALASEAKGERVSWFCCCCECLAVLKTRTKTLLSCSCASDSDSCICNIHGINMQSGAASTRFGGKSRVKADHIFCRSQWAG